LAEEIVFPEFSARTYGLVVYNPKNVVMLSPVNFFMGDVLTTERRALMEEFAAWKRFKNESKDFVQLFPLDNKRLVWTGELKEDLSAQRRFRRLDELPLEEIIAAAVDKIRIKEGNEDLLDYHGHLDPSLRAISRAHGEAKMLTANVKNYGIKRGSDQQKYYSVQVDGPYVDSSPRFNDVRCQCLDSFWSNTRRGDSNFQAVCKHAAALINYLSKHLDAMETYLRLQQEFRRTNRQLRIFSPFHTDYVRPEVLNFFEAENLPHIARGKKQPRLDHLKLDVLLTVLFENLGQAEINKRLLRLPVYDLETVKMLLDGNAFFEVMPDSQLFGVDSQVSKEMRNFYKAIDRELNRQGFRIHGYCYEKKDSEHEVIAVNYTPNPKNPQNAAGEARVLFSRNYPPVVIRRTPLEGARIYPFREHKIHSHPYSELFLDPNGTRRFDDRKRKYDHYTVEFPQCFIPDELLPHYAKAVHDYFPGGFERLVCLAEHPVNPRIHLPPKSLVYRMEKMLK
jgi:hypothetical protein